MNTYHDLAEAMRKGAALRPQIQAEYFGYRSDADDLRSCALGAAYEGQVGKADNNVGIADIEVLFPVIYKDYASCPVCGDSVSLEDVITSLNDDHAWTREAIADWLDSLVTGDQP